MYDKIAIFGVSGAIAQAFLTHIKQAYPTASIWVFGRSQPVVPLKNVNYHVIDYNTEASLSKTSECLPPALQFDLVLVATGVLHDGKLQPEKCLQDVSIEKFQKVFTANSIVPAMIAKYFLPRLNKNRRAIFAVLSARVGSISDNRLGGWYAYRASKAALNMLIKNLAIEHGRFCKQSIIVGLHPGTVNSALSKPFSQRVPPEKLFSAAQSVDHMMRVLSALSEHDTGKCWAWDGEEVLP